MVWQIDLDLLDSLCGKERYEVSDEGLMAEVTKEGCVTPPFPEHIPGCEPNMYLELSFATGETKS